jgi:hypothetical protein
MKGSSSSSKNVYSEHAERPQICDAAEMSFITHAFSVAATVLLRYFTVANNRTANTGVVCLGQKCCNGGAAK